MIFSKKSNEAIERERFPEEVRGEKDLTAIFSSFVGVSGFDLIKWNRKLNELSRLLSQPDHYQIAVNIHDVPEPARVMVMKALKAAVDSGVRRSGKPRVDIKVTVISDKRFRFHSDVINAFTSGIEWKDSGTNN